MICKKLLAAIQATIFMLLHSHKYGHDITHGDNIDITSALLDCCFLQTKQSNKKKVFASVAILGSQLLHLSLKDFPEINRGEWLPAEI